MPLALVDSRIERGSDEVSREKSPTELSGAALSVTVRVEQALRAAKYSELQRIKVSVRGRVVVLGGCVRSYHMKQLAQSIAMDVSGIRNLRNDVEVIRPPSVKDSHE